MTSDPGFEPWRGAVYHGYSAPPAEPLAPPPPSAAGLTHHRPVRGIVVMSGVAIALALGLGVGFLAQPDLGPPAGQAAPMAPAAPGAQQGLTIQPVAMAAAPPAPAPKTSGKLVVLPPDMVAAAARAAPVGAPARSAETAVRDVSDVVASPEPARPLAPAPPYPSQAIQSRPYLGPPEPSRAYPRLAAIDPSCIGGGGRAAQMVCSDPDLSAADRALNQAYRRALRSGALPPDELRADQRDWLAMREDAARRSPRALAQVYDQRIDELNDLADRAPEN